MCLAIHRAGVGVDAVKQLSPAYFALVMATGIVSVGAWDFELGALAIGLLVFNIVAYIAIAMLTILRAIRYPDLFASDITSHRQAPGFFTAVAGSCILGVQVRDYQQEMAPQFEEIGFQTSGRYLLLVKHIAVQVMERRMTPVLTRA